MATSTLLLKHSRQFLNDDDNYKEQQVYSEKLQVKDNLSLIIPINILEAFDKVRLAFMRAVPRKSITYSYRPSYDGQYHYSLQEILSIYNKLLKLNMENKKALEILINVTKIGIYFNNFRSISILLNYLGNKPSLKVYIIDKYQLFQILKADILQDTDNFSIEYYLAYKELQASTYSSICISLAKITLSRNRIAKAFEEITQLPFFYSNTVFRNFLCKWLCSYFIEHDSFEMNIRKYGPYLTKGIERSKYSKLLTSMVYYDLKMYSEAYNYKYSIDFDYIEDIEAVFIIKCLYMLRQWANIDKFVINLLVKVKDTYYANKLKKYLFLSYAEQKKWRHAIKVGSELDPLANLDVYDIYVLSKCYVENGQNADHLTQYLQMTKYYIQIQALVLLKQKKFEQVFEILDQRTTDPVECIYIAQAYWQLNNFDNCYFYLLRATLNYPNSADIYYNMGLFYEDVKHNTDMARMCLEKAYTLNMVDINIIKSLSDIYIKGGHKTENFMLLKSVSQYVMDQSWIYYSIALYYMEYKQWESAIKNLLRAIRCNDSYPDAYERLAEAYFSFGYLKSAHETYRKLILLNPQKNIYYLVKIGEICTALKQYPDAIRAYEQVLESEPNHLIATIGIARTLMNFAHFKANSQLYHIARDAVQSIINYLVATLSTTKTMIPLWKLLGDAILFISKLPDDYSFVHIRFTNAEFGYMGVLHMKTSMYKLAYSCYWRARSILPIPVDRVICDRIADEIYEDEESADLFRYSCPTDLGFGYVEWLKSVLNDPGPGYSRNFL